MAKGIVEATGKIYEQLEGLAPEERRRAVDAALTMLGEPTISNHTATVTSQQDDETPSDEFCNSAKAWIKKNNLEHAALLEMFHFDNGKVTLILGSPIGRSKREQTLNTYLLTGVASLLETSIAEFLDETAAQELPASGLLRPRESFSIRQEGFWEQDYRFQDLRLEAHSPWSFRSGQTNLS